MANKKVVVTGRTAFFDLIMDETAVAGYISAAAGVGHFVSPDADIYIPYPLAEIVVQTEQFEQAPRQAPNNFGPGNQI